MDINIFYEPETIFIIKTNEKVRKVTEGIYLSENSHFIFKHEKGIIINKSTNVLLKSENLFIEEDYGFTNFFSKRVCTMNQLCA